MIRCGLRKTIERVESMACKRRRHDPFVVRLVKPFVDEWVVQVSMNPVNAKVGKDKEKRKLENVVPETGPLVGRVVELAVAADFNEEDGRGANCHKRHRLVRLDDFKPDLAFDESGMVHSALVKDDIVGECRKDKVDE